MSDDEEGCEQKEEDTANTRRRNNPMLNTLILERVFANCHDERSKDDWASYRQVCRVWSQETWETWRALAVITLFQDKTTTEQHFSSLSTSTNQQKLVMKGGLSIPEFMELYEKDEYQLKSSPFKHFKFKLWNLDESPSSSPLFQDFWSIIGPHIESLRFEQCFASQFGAPGFQDIIFKMLENLKDLKMSENSFRLPSGEDDQRQWSQLQARLNGNEKRNESVLKLDLSGAIPFELRIFYALFPNVESICLSYGGLSEKLTSTLYDNGWWLPPDKVRHLDMMSLKCRDVSSTVQTFKYMAKHNQGYETLGFQVETNLQFVHGIKHLLEAESRTLKYLKICKKPFSHLSGFSTFQNSFTLLEELQLWGRSDGGFQFLCSMPQLRKLYVNQDCFELWDVIKDDIAKGEVINVQPSSNDLIWECDSAQNRKLIELRMEFLHYLHIDNKFSVESLTKMSEWFPSLKTLHLIADNEQFRVISKEWGKKLMELCLLYGSSVDDDGICDSIQNFTELRIFSLETKCGEGKITDKSVHDGFLKLFPPLLHTLRVCVAPGMTETAEDLLSEKIFSVKVIRNYGESHQGECCLRKQFEAEAFRSLPK